MKKTVIAAAALLTGMFVATVPAHAQVSVLADDFEVNDLNLWVGHLGGPHDGVIVADPLNPTNHVLTFSAVNSGGDMFRALPVGVDPTIQQLKLSFDFLALPIGGVAPSEYGGFAGINTDTIGLAPFWLAGTFLPEVMVPPGVPLATDGQWHHYSIDFTALAAAHNLTNFFVLLEDWSGRGSIPGDIYFDNVQVSAKLNPEVVAALVPCAGPLTGGPWKNHGAYVSSMSQVTDALVAAGLITLAEQNGYISAAAQSNCGK